MKKYTENAKKSLEICEELALLNGNVINTTVLLNALIKNRNSTASVFLQKYGLTEEKVGTFLYKKSKPDSDVIFLTNTVKDILDDAEQTARADRAPINTFHILLSITKKTTCTAAKILDRYNVRTVNVVDTKSVFAMNIPFEQTQNDEKKIVEKTNQTSAFEAHTTSTFDDLNYLTDITKEAERGYIPKIIGMRNELGRLLRVLTRSQKNNPILIGESGVGKTSLVRLLAQKIAEGDVPDLLKRKKILSVHLTGVIAGTKYRGELEEKFDELFARTQDKDVILFFDDIHNVATMGSSESPSSIGSVLKPILEKNNVTIIGATTYASYGKYLEKDPIFERLFTKIHIKEPTRYDMFQIIEQAKETYEKHYSLRILPDALQSAIDLSIRYIPNRHLPDKALDLLDETCSMASAQKMNEVTEKEVQSILTEMTGIPIAEEDDSERFLHVNEQLRKRIIGQDEAIDAISQCLLRAKAGFRDKAKPIGSFLFLGSTGVGKTETAKALAEILFGTKNALIRLDMSEYSDKNSASKLIGAPPGYVGYEEGGFLTEKIKNNPFSVILLDEIEKAYIDIFDTLLQVLDDGRLTDSKGITVDFRNTIIIMTSNIGSREVANQNTIGFANTRKAENERDTRLQCLKNIFRPEFINRIDSIISFRKLDKENLSKIADNIIEEKKANLLRERGIVLHLSQEIREEIVRRSGENNEFGARPLRRMIETLLENELSERILQQNMKNKEIFVSFTNGKTKITVKQ